MSLFFITLSSLFLSVFLIALATCDSYDDVGITAGLAEEFNRLLKGVDSLRMDLAASGDFCLQLGK